MSVPPTGVGGMTLSPASTVMSLVITSISDKNTRFIIVVSSKRYRQRSQELLVILLYAAVRRSLWKSVTDVCFCPPIPPVFSRPDERHLVNGCDYAGMETGAHGLTQAKMPKRDRRQTDERAGLHCGACGTIVPSAT